LGIIVLPASTLLYPEKSGKDPRHLNTENKEPILALESIAKKSSLPSNRMKLDLLDVAAVSFISKG
jgi:hypothetical protein